MLPMLVCMVGAMSVVASAAEGDVVAIPKLEKRVTDLTATLSSVEEARIEARLREFEAKKGAQVAVLIIGTTTPETIFDYSVRVAEAWKLGRKDVDDGVLFVVAKNDRKLQILTGRGTQGVLTDAMSKRIISEVVAPKFRASDFAGGIEDGVAKITDVLQGEALPPPQKKRVAVEQGGGNVQSFLFIAFNQLSDFSEKSRCFSPIFQGIRFLFFVYFQLIGQLFLILFCNTFGILLRINNVLFIANALCFYIIQYF